MNTKKTLFLLYSFLPLCFLHSGDYDYDVSVFGSILYADGIGRQAITLIDMLKENINIRFISTGPNSLNLTDVPSNVASIVQKSLTDRKKSITI